MLGLCGGHRVGKSTLARAFAEKSGLTFIETSASSVFKEMGLDPAQTYDFTTRLSVQEQILETFEGIYSHHATGGLCVTDRTPIDLMAYTLAEAVGDSVSAQDQDRFAKYVERCIEVTNRRFCALVVVQPGIPLVHENGKAALNVAYIEHLNSIILGLSIDERVNVSHFYIPRYMTDINERVAAVEYVVGKIKVRATQEMRSGFYPVH